MQQMKQRSEHQQGQQFWARVVMRKWLNMGNKESAYSADPDEDDPDTSDSDNEELGRQSRFRDRREENEDPPESNEYLPRLRRQKSSTFRTQYINTKEMRVCVGTWNVGGRLPPDDLDIDEWLGVNDPADIYVLGFQELVPLNPGNIFGAEDTRPVPKWENIVRETLNRVRPASVKVKSFSDPPSPSKFKPSDDVPDVEEEILLESDSDICEEVHPLNEEHHVSEGGTEGPVAEKIMNTDLQASDAANIVNSGMPVDLNLQRQFSSPRRLNRLNCFRNEELSENIDTSFSQQTTKLSRMLSGSERIGLSWPEPPLHLLSQKVLDRPSSFKSIQTFKASKSFKEYNSFKSSINEIPPEIALLAETDLETLMKRKRRSHYVRITSKQMVGIFITIWVRRGLRKHIQNLKVSTVGVGVMGYIGNKGSISVSMSIYQTIFCFICSHLTAGEKEGDEIKRNADVLEIHRRTQFYSLADIGLPKSILDHDDDFSEGIFISRIKNLIIESYGYIVRSSSGIFYDYRRSVKELKRIIWLGDLNYRINLSYDETRNLISKKEWAKLVEKDQLTREVRKGVFGGWSEGTLNFPPTYKYEMKSDKYYGEDPKVGRRTPAWCDRILSYGKGIRLLSYRRTELKFSDHRPVTATFMAEVEVFSPRKLQRALTFTDAEIENEEVITNLGSWN